MENFELIIAGVLLLTQIIFCLKVKNIFICLIPTSLAFFLSLALTLMIFFSEGLEVIVYLLLAIYSWILLLLLGVCWLVWAIAKAMSKRRQNQ